jgi:CRISPR/Cas system-associated exonuclease Cas4 (RecB family)
MLRSVAQELLVGFKEEPNVARQFARLASKVKSRLDLPDEALSLLLFNSATLDTFYQTAALRYVRARTDGPRHALNSLIVRAHFDPAKHLKLSGGCAPDLIFPKFNAIGEIKSGDLKTEHLIAVAGYALAYESRHAADVNLGILYLVETSPDIIGSSNLVFFWISDELRARFLLRRDQALAVVRPGGREPDVISEATQVERYCERCTFYRVCHPADDVADASHSATAATDAPANT